MKRIRILHRLALLAALLLTAAEAGAQLVQYEYWFDRGFARRQTASLSGSTATIRTAIDTQQLDDGVHTLHLRVKQSDGAYSPVTSSTFLKFKAQEGTVLEYWFDDNVDSRATVALANTDGQEQQVVLDLSDNKRFPIGLHRLNYRVAANGSNYSPIYGDNVMKATSGEVCRLEYWFDEDFEHRAVADMAPLALMDNFSLELNLQNRTQFPQGQHRLNMRVVADESHYSPVYSTWLLDVAAGSPTTLQYWVDDDYENARTLSGTQAGKNVLHDAEIDLGSTSPGFHRLNYRATSNSRKTNSPVATMPVMVRSRYDVNDPELKVTRFSVAVDDEKPRAYDVNHPSLEITQPYTVTPTTDSESHQVSMTFTNSQGLTVTESYPFSTAKTTEEPVVTLTAKVENGMVYLNYNSVPNDKGSRVYRIDGQGNRVTVSNSNTSHFPSGWEFVDNPGAGNYTYQVKVAYWTAEDVSASIASNEVAVQVEEARAEADKLGTLIGHISFVDPDGTPVTYRESLDVFFSDGTSVKATNGNFTRSGLKMGEEMTISIPDNEYYTFEDHSFVVERINKVFLVGKQKVRNLQDDYSKSQLEVQQLTWDETGIDITIQNCSEYSWVGNVTAFAYEKAAYDKVQKQGGKLSDLETKKINLEKKKLTFGRMETKPLRWSFSSLINPKKDVDYYIFLMYNTTNQPEWQNLYFNAKAGTNPLSWTAFKTTYTDFQQYVDDCVDMMKTLLSYTKYVTADPKKPTADWAKDLAKVEDEDDFREYWEKQSLYWLSRYEREMSKDFAKEIEKIKDKEKCLKKVKEFTEIIEKARNLRTAETTSDKNVLFFRICKNIFKEAGLAKGNPFMEIYLKYFEVGEKMAALIADYMGALVIPNMPAALAEGDVTVRVKIAKNTLFDFAIPSYFDHTMFGPRESEHGYEIPAEILSASIVTTDLTGMEYPVDIVADYSHEDYIEFRQDGKHNGPLGGYTLSSMMLVINWENGRVTKVPLFTDNKYDAVEVDGNLQNPILLVYLKSGTQYSSEVPDKSLRIGKKDE